jgi:hypothetical protein
VGRSDGIVELRRRRRSGEAEKENEECESSIDHARPLRAASIVMKSPDHTIKTATV